MLGRDTAELSASERRSMRRDVNIVFQDPLASLDPRLPVSDILAEPMRTHGMNGDQVAARIRELLRLVGPEPRARGALPAAVLGRSAPAHRDRARARARALAARPRRARVRARRLDPGRRHQPARGAPGPAGALLPVRGARPRGRPPHRRPDRRDVPRQDRRDRRRDARLRARRRIRTRRRCCRRSRFPTRTRSAPGVVSCWRETCPARRIHRLVAASGPAAPSSPPSTRSGGAVPGGGAAVVRRRGRPFGALATTRKR